MTVHNGLQTKITMANVQCGSKKWGVGEHITTTYNGDGPTDKGWVGERDSTLLRIIVCYLFTNYNDDGLIGRGNGKRPHII